jgi:hypothetical protein
MQDCKKKGRNFIARGEKSGKTKLTAQDVMDIRQHYEVRTARELAQEYGMSIHGIRSILRRNTWKHVP